jgi:hypothetical protein
VVDGTPVIRPEPLPSSSSEASARATRRSVTRMRDGASRNKPKEVDLGRGPLVRRAFELYALSVSVLTAWRARRPHLV